MEISRIWCIGMHISVHNKNSGLLLLVSELFARHLAGYPIGYSRAKIWGPVISLFRSPKTLRSLFGYQVSFLFYSARYSILVYHKMDILVTVFLESYTVVVFASLIDSVVCNEICLCLAIVFILLFLINW